MGVSVAESADYTKPLKGIVGTRTVAPASPLPTVPSVILHLSTSSQHRCGVSGCSERETGTPDTDDHTTAEALSQHRTASLQLFPTIRTPRTNGLLGGIQHMPGHSICKGWLRGFQRSLLGDESTVDGIGGWERCFIADQPQAMGRAHRHHGWCCFPRCLIAQFTVSWISYWVVISEMDGRRA